jgi:hypothetical protein
LDWRNHSWHYSWLDVWLGVLMSKHEEIIVKFMEKNPTWKRFKFCQELNKVFKDDLFDALNYIPDGFEINKEKNTINLLEVDGTSGASKRKVANIAGLWWEIDGRSWFLTLTSIAVHTGATSFMDDFEIGNLAMRKDIEIVKKEMEMQ